VATEPEIVNSLNDWLRAKGFTCGRNFASIGDVAKSIGASTPGETPQSIEPKIRKIVASPAYGFKTRGSSDVSASDPKDPKCGGG
jgi:hypothetical protein